jgi:2-desacetyl-2-hydroxyethyl bacteriochlorophyllide A dehydrogenase
MGRALVANGNPVLHRLTRAQCLREAAYFRLHKIFGTMKGLLEEHPLETDEERQEVFFEAAARAVIIHGPGKASLEEVQVPELKPGEILIHVAHVGVCATDIEILEGSLGYYKNGEANYPIVPGHEFSGIVVATGSNVNGLAEGDAAVVECIQSCGTCGECRSGNFIGCAERTELGVMKHDGAYADYVSVPARFVHKLPPSTDLRAAALCEPLAVVLKGLRRLELALGGASENSRCAVIGGGPIGHICARVMAHRGHRVTVFDRNPRRLAYFRGSTIETSESLDGLDEFNIITEVTGDPEALETALHRSRANATLLLLGLPYGMREFSFESIAAYDKTVIGSVGSTDEDFKKAIHLLPELDLDEFFKCPMPLADFAKGWEMSKRGEVLKVILDVVVAPGDRADQVR